MRHALSNLALSMSVVAVSLNAQAATTAPKTASGKTEPVAKSAGPVRQKAVPPRMPLMESVDTLLLHGMQYRYAGQTYGGRVTTVTGNSVTAAHISHGCCKWRAVQDH